MLKHQGAGIALTVIVFYLDLIAGQDLPGDWLQSPEKFLNQLEAIEYCAGLQKDGSMWRLTKFHDEDAKRLLTVLDALDTESAYWIDMKCLPEGKTPKGCKKWVVAPEVIEEFLWAKGQPTGVTGENMSVPEFCAQVGQYAGEKRWGINDVPCEGYEGYALCKKQKGD